KSLSSIQVRHTTSKVSPVSEFSRERFTFDVPLEILVQDVMQCGVPFLVTQMVEYLEVFGKFMVFFFFHCVDVYSVARLLKLFLKGLPVAVFPDNICSGLLKTFQEHKIHTTECIENLRQLLSCLPKAHQNLLQFLSAFLLKVATYSAVNFTTLKNLVFGPALFK
ncbi:FA13A protein, partial [Halcyon senegalensis]|nr:FA13A protein [Halcyon senegalensis]